MYPIHSAKDDFSFINRITASASFCMITSSPTYEIFSTLLEQDSRGKFPKHSKIYDHQRLTPKVRMDGENSQLCETSSV
jgi:hypothetical protein